MIGQPSTAIIALWFGGASRPIVDQPIRPPLRYWLEHRWSDGLALGSGRVRHTVFGRNRPAVFAHQSPPHRNSFDLRIRAKRYCGLAHRDWAIELHFSSIATRRASVKPPFDRPEASEQFPLALVVRRRSARKDTRARRLAGLFALSRLFLDSHKRAILSCSRHIACGAMGKQSGTANGRRDAPARAQRQGRNPGRIRGDLTRESPTNECGPSG